MELEKGMMIELIDPEGNKIPAEGFEILDEVVKMDLNHFLAGKSLVFDIEILVAGLSKDTDYKNCGGGHGPTALRGKATMKFLEKIFSAGGNTAKKEEIGRNDACPCGSGKKYKRCCLEGDEKKRRKQLGTGLKIP